MKSLRLISTGELKIINVEEPQIKNPTEVKIKMSYSSICGVDVMMYRGTANKIPQGVMGHEGSGIIVDLGEEAAKYLNAGDPVTINPVFICHHCKSCHNLSVTCCELGTATDLSIKSSSMMSEYIVVHYLQVFPLPQGISLKEGCLAEPVTMALYTVNKAALAPGNKVLILGGGSMGQLILRLCMLYPVASVVVADPHREKRELALRGKATVVLDSRSESFIPDILEQCNGKGFEVVIEASGSQQSAETAFSFLARGGCLIYFGLYGMDFSVSLNLFNLYWKDATIRGVFMPKNLYHQALDLIPRLGVEDIITALYPFDKAEEAFSEKARGQHVKVMLEFC
jgi:(R,R)-butanediol dehydrogenase/meso-butanediol dehydrogenase/diacetyl reductase/L-iditol 2-dehydrogenase